MLSRLVPLLIVGCARGVYVGSQRVSDGRQALKAALSQSSMASTVNGAPALGRREFVGSSAAALAAFARVAEVDASGGATAGGVYLLRAKERYNSRVMAGVEDFKAAEGYDDKALASYFSGKSFEDLCASAFLLASAFRTNSAQGPDKILQVKLYKDFKKEADEASSLLKKKKDPKEAYSRASSALDAYLSSVGLLVPL